MEKKETQVIAKISKLEKTVTRLQQSLFKNGRLTDAEANLLNKTAEEIKNIKHQAIYDRYTDPNNPITLKSLSKFWSLSVGRLSQIIKVEKERRVRTNLHSNPLCPEAAFESQGVQKPDGLNNLCAEMLDSLPERLGAIPFTSLSLDQVFVINPNGHEAFRVIKVFEAETPTLSELEEKLISVIEKAHPTKTYLIVNIFTGDEHIAFSNGGTILLYQKGLSGPTISELRYGAKGVFLIEL